MKKHLYIILLLIFLTISTDALSQRSYKELSLHVAPLSLIDPLTGTWQFGLQKQFNKNLALSLDYGLQANIYGKDSRYHTSRKDYKYSKTRMELKYFFHNPIMDSLMTVAPYYLSVEGMYFPQTYRKEDDWIFRGQDSYRYEHSDIKRDVWVMNIKFGREEKIRQLILDYYIGLGIRRISIKHQTFGEVEEEYIQPTDFGFPAIDREQGIFYRPNFVLGFKMGYIIR